MIDTREKRVKPVMTKVLFQFAAISVIWFLVWASVSGPLSLFATSWLKKIKVAGAVLFWIGFVIYWGCAIGVYYGGLFYQTRHTPPYDALSSLAVFLVGSAPFLVAAVVGFWFMRQLRFGW